MPRKFHTSARLQKALQWVLNGTTMEISWAKQNLENAVELDHELRKKAVKAIINGNPHETKRRDGTVDDRHVSGVLQTDSDRRLTSYHIYESGLVLFSKEKYNTRTFGGSGSSSQAQASSSTASSGRLTWQMSADGTRAEWWDGTAWQPGRWSDEQRKWVAYYNGAWHAWESQKAS
ncbi:hypothetical protein F4802DRAFT_315775 [Xylaria palmicola]|nr:hypothetical protein F4802DRAFT_315775 [Xylaria palmicola]